MSEKDFNKKPYFRSNRKYFTICVYALAVITIGTAIIYMIVNAEQTKNNFNELMSALSPFLGAIFIAFLLNPIVNFLYKKVFNRLFRGKATSLSKFLSILFSYLLAIGIITITILYILPELAQSVKDLRVIVPSIVDTVIDFLNNIEALFPNLDIEWIEEKLQQLLPNLLTYGTNFLSNLVPFLYSFSVSLVKVVINLLLSIVVSCYMLADKTILAKNCKRAAYALLPTKNVQAYIDTAKECLGMFTGFIVGKSVDSLIIGCLCYLIMSILKMPYALLISVIVGVTNMIPYFGPFIGAVPGIVIYLFISPLRAVGFAIMILCLQQFDGLILGPKILGSSTGLKPLWVILAITLGGAYGGVLGMFLGVPVTAVIVHLLDKFIHSRLVRRHIPDEF